MSYKSSLIKIACNNTPKKMVFWLVNKKLKGIAKLKDYVIDFDDRKIHTKVLLEGEEELIEVSLEDFALIKDEEYYLFVIQSVQANRPWLNNMLAKAILGREIKIPQSQTQLVQELFFPDSTDVEDEQKE